MKRIVTWSATAALALSPLALAVTTAQVSAAPGSSSSVSITAQSKAGVYQVTAKANKKVAIAREDKIKVTGRVSPKATGQKVILQQRVGNKKKWAVTGTSKVKNNGKFLLQDKPSVPGTREYRVLKPGSNGTMKGLSKPMTVVVYRWEKLGYRSVGPKSNLNINTVEINTDRYAGSLVSATSGTPAYVEFTLGKKCTSLRSSYALTDAAETGSTGSIAISTDGRARVTYPLVLGTVVADKVTDLTDVFRIRFDLTTSASPVGVAAVASPEVLCTR